MVYLNFFFFCFLIIFAVIGAMRGWAKEMLVTFSSVLALFIITVLETYVAPISQSFALPGSAAQFWMRLVILIMLAFFGYQTPNLPKLSGSGKWARERLQDTLLGVFLGVLNGYLIVGTLWYFIAQAGYQPISYIVAPDPNNPVGQAAIRMLTWMAPAWLVTPYIYFAVGLAFIFVIVVFL